MRAQKKLDMPAPRVRFSFAPGGEGIDRPTNRGRQCRRTVLGASTVAFFCKGQLPPRWEQRLQRPE